MLVSDWIIAGIGAVFLICLPVWGIYANKQTAKDIKQLDEDIKRLRAERGSRLTSTTSICSIHTDEYRSLRDQQDAVQINTSNIVNM